MQNSENNSDIFLNRLFAKDNIRKSYFNTQYLFSYNYQTGTNQKSENNNSQGVNSVQP